MTNRYRFFTFLVGTLYALSATSLILWPGRFQRALNIIPNQLQVFEPLQESPFGLWMGFAALFWVLVSVVYFFSSAFPRVKGYFLILLSAHGAAVALFVHSFLTVQKLFVFVLGAGVNTLLLLILTWYFSSSLSSERQKNLARSGTMDPEPMGAKRDKPEPLARELEDPSTHAKPTL